MKHMLTLGLILLTLLANAQTSSGIQFHKGSWSKALAEARKTGKMVFVDMYTDWCVPCKKMEKEIFPLPEVGEKYNANFINIQLDAEGSGRAVAQEFNVRAYPTYLWVTGNGELVHRASAYSDKPDVFLKHADNALQAAKTQLPGELKKKYEQKKTGKAFLREYVTTMHMLEKGLEVAKGVDQYFSLLNATELQQPEHAGFLMRHVNRITSPAFTYILGHQSFFAEKAVLTEDMEPNVIRNSNAEKLAVILQNIVIETMMDSMSANNIQLVELAGILYRKIEHPSVSAYLTFNAFRLQHLYQTRADGRYLKEGVPYVDSLATLSTEHLSRLDELRFKELATKDERHRYAYTGQLSAVMMGNAFYYSKMVAPGTPEFEKVLAWAKKGIEYSKGNPELYVDLAKLYELAGRNEEAKAALRTAINKADGSNKEEKIKRYQAKLESIR